MTLWPEHRGILLVGGRGTRLYPLTAIASKQLAPVYNKPMVYYSLTTLMMSGVRKILVVAAPDSIDRYRMLLGTGSDWGIELTYEVQDEPRGIAEAFVIGEEFLADRPSMLVLGDNVFFGRLDFLRHALIEHDDEAIVFAYHVADPSEYGVVEFGEDGAVISLEEKPSSPRSQWAVPGMYLYPPGVSKMARRLRPSGRGEYEITDLNRSYLEEGRLHAVPLGRGIAWFDTGTAQALLEAGAFIEAIEQRQGLIIGSPEEVAFRMGFVDAGQLAACLTAMPECPYRSYLERVLGEG